MIVSEATENSEVEVTGVSACTMKPLSIETVARIVGAEARGVDARVSHIRGVSTDSRTVRPGDCFFAIAGENFDGHNYVGEVLQKGAACAVVSRPVNGEPAPGAVLRVADAVAALGDLAREYRRMNAFTVVAITGSVGKTTTRQIIHHILSRRFRTHQAQKSFNNNIGLPLTLLSAGADVQVIVAELGANHPGEIAYLTRIARPDIAVVTNAYPAHLEGFGSLDAIVREKLSITEGLSGDGILIVNGDIELVVAACRGRGRDFCTFGTSAGATYRAQDIVCNALDSTFTIHGTQVRLPLAGPGNVENALTAWAVCDRLGVTAGQFAEALESLPGVAMRGEPLRIGTLLVLNDCYNANPASMKNALAMLRNLRSGENVGRRIVFICGDMAELGAETESLHAELGRAVAQAGVDVLLTIGESSRVTARVATETAGHDLQAMSFADTGFACDRMQEFIRSDDIVLVKGSRVARLERVVEKLMKDYG